MERAIDSYHLEEDVLSTTTATRARPRAATGQTSPGMRLRAIGSARCICALLQILAAAAAQAPPANSRTPTQEQCTRPTVNPACFDPTKLVDRVVYCANSGR